MTDIKAENHSDIKDDRLLLRLCPPAIKPYILLTRLDRPIGIWLLLLPSLWSIILATGGPMIMQPKDSITIAFFIAGAIIMRSAGCIINDLWDYKIDRQVTRTKNRPLANASISKTSAFIALFICLTLGLIILLQMSLLTILLGLLALPLIILYPMMKRITWWPQAFLGLVFNFGALMGWSAITGTLEPTSLILYVSGVFWTLGYDTIYAHQDKEGDSLIGMKSSALKLGKNSKKWVKRFYITASLLLIFATISAGSTHAPIGLIPALIYLAWILRNWDEERPESALSTFKANKNFGLLVLIGLIAGQLL